MSLLRRGSKNYYTYGITYGDGNWRIGYVIVKLQEDDLIMGDVVFKGTSGLFEIT